MLYNCKQDWFINTAYKKLCVGALQQSTLEHSCSLILMAGLADAKPFPTIHSCDVWRMPSTGP